MPRYRQPVPKQQPNNAIPRVYLVYSEVQTHQCCQTHPRLEQSRKASRRLQLQAFRSIRSQKTSQTTCDGENCLFDDELRNAIALFDLELLVAEVRQYHSHFTAVVCVYDAGERVNAVLECQTRSRSHTAVCNKVDVRTREGKRK